MVLIGSKEVMKTTLGIQEACWRANLATFAGPVRQKGE